ncbi:DEAD/DEAH box helicase domain [Arabidopsis suecica]|uniref:DEAD/DEAH box helicase domain n=2 Tax=Arabidopsis suecica TaxID=45249 RepID=A0A8T2AH55_ARASU|nr:DEAD/DEAH box helicase domain [Arabidopsis suecica]
MAKGDDNVQRKKNKLTRKKMSRKNDTATVSARISAIIAAKKRRKSGKRSMCQGMCFTLPTLEDPFNERQGKADITKKKKKKKKVKSREEKKPSTMSIDGVEKKMDGPLKFLMLNLNEIESSFRKDSTYSEQHDTSLFTSTWGIEFWKCFSSGKDILETSGMSSTVEQIAWIVSSAADAIAKREKDEEEEEELLGNSPFLLYLVPSQSKASQVRSVCKALKGIGIHTVSLHQGASLDHQISGLKSVEPEFIVATPERLLEIVTLKGVDISCVSLLVIDELGSLCTGGYLDAVKSIKQAISSKHQSIVFNDSFSTSTIPAVQSLLRGSINRVTVSDSVASQGSCIIQTVNVCASEEKKLQKFAEHLDSSSSKIIYIVTKEESFKKIKALLKLKGLSVSTESDSKISGVKKSRKPVAHLVDIEQLDTTVMRDFETVLLPDFFPSIEIYTQILTSMARESVHGVLHSFITEKEAASYRAGSLVNVLENCGQNVPDPWRHMYVAMSD